jgi:hypothetical protein
VINKHFQLAIGIFLACATPANAQPLFNFITRTTIPIVIQCPGCNNANRGKRPNTPARNTILHADTAKLAYRPSTAVHQRTLTQIIENTRVQDPAGAQKIEQLLSSKNIIAKINQDMPRLGLQPNNVADAYALYWASAWQGAQGRNDDLPKAQMIAVRGQAAEALLKLSQFRSATDAQKQEMSEIMLIQSALILLSIESVKSDPALLAQTQTAIAKGAERFGLNLNSMTLTAQGFRPTSK